MIATVIAFERRKLARLVTGEFFFLDNSSAGTARFDDRGRGLAAIEAVRALRADQAQRICEVALHQLLASGKGHSPAEEDGGRGREFSEIVGRRREQIDVTLVPRE